MKIKSIFADKKNNGLHSFQYSGNKLPELDRLFELWYDRQWIRDYLNLNYSYLKNPHFKGCSIEKLSEQILDEAEALNNVLIHCEEGKIELRTVFSQLVDTDYKLEKIYQFNKASSNRKFKVSPLLRIYTIKLHEDCYIVTGGAIKLVKKMKDHFDTRNELIKFEDCKKYLIKKEIQFDEDLIEYYAEES